MRASDEDRQRAVDELRRHCAAGRIDVDDYALRIEKALAAATLEELHEVRRDLPMLRVPAPVGGGVWAPGGRRRAPRPPRGEGGPDGAPAPGRATAIAIAALAALILAGVVALAVAAEWAWAIVLLAGWLVGLLHGRLAGMTKRSR